MTSGRSLLENNSNSRGLHYLPHPMKLNLASALKKETMNHALRTMEKISYLESQVGNCDF
jgi:hypothetical protein